MIPTERPSIFKSIRARIIQMRKPPVMTMFLAALQTVFFVSNCISRDHTMDKCIVPTSRNVRFVDYFSHWMWWTRGCTSHDKRTHVWRYGSSLVSHYGVSHLINNLVLTLILGTDMEWIYGSRALLIVWFISGVSGIWSYQAWKNVTDRSTTRLVGSSGAVYGLIGCRISNVILNGDSMYTPELVYRVFFILVYILLDSVIFLIDRNTSIAYTAHWGGVLGGVLGGLAMFKNFDERRWEHATSSILICILSVYLTIANVLTYAPKLESC